MTISNGTHMSANRLGTDSVHAGDQLRAENEELRALVLELEQALQAHTGGADDWEARAREYVVQFLDEQLRHTRFFIGDLENEPGAPAEAPELYWLMRRVAVDDRLQAWSAVNDYLQSRRNGKAHLSEVDRIPGCR